MIEDDGFETVRATKPALITLTLDAYNNIQRDAALQERLRIMAWLRSANQPMTHTAWAIAKAIETEEHYK